MKSFVFRSFLGFLTILFSGILLRAQPGNANIQEVLAMLERGESVENVVMELSGINFSTSSATLESRGKEYLDQVAQVLLALPAMQLEINGHTDNTGSAAINQKLSTERAASVLQYLAEKGVSRAQLRSQGFGSSKPIADNGTVEGRAKNRRVDLVIIKLETATAIQDVIVFRDGRHMGVHVQDYTNDIINYLQLSNSTKKQLATSGVEKIIFADGRVVTFDEPEPERAPAKRKSSTPDFRLFDESEAFHKGQFILCFGVGLGNNVGIKFNEITFVVPPVVALLELPIGKNIGVGVQGGAFIWKPKTEESTQLSYYAISPRLSYHFNLGESVDLYVGAAATGRMIRLESTQADSTRIDINRRKIDVGGIVGMRYYFKDHLGVYAEYGNDNVACGRAGLSIRFGK